MRIKPLPEQQAPETIRELYRRSIERLGRVPVPLAVMAHRPEIAEGYSAMGGALGGSIVVEPRLKTLACIRAAQMIGCPF